MMSPRRYLAYTFTKSALLYYRVVAMPYLPYPNVMTRAVRMSLSAIGTATSHLTAP
jgi:hypothetical protein